MPNTRYQLETTGGMGGNQRALSSVSLDMDDIAQRMDTAESTLSSLPYSASTPADWGGTAPTTVKDALDRIAAALGPIP